MRYTWVKYNQVKHRWVKYRWAKCKCVKCRRVMFAASPRLARQLRSGGAKLRYFHSLNFMVWRGAALAQNKAGKLVIRAAPNTTREWGQRGVRQGNGKGCVEPVEEGGEKRERKVEGKDRGKWMREWKGEGGIGLEIRSWEMMREGKGEWWVEEGEGMSKGELPWVKYFNYVCKMREKKWNILSIYKSKGKN